MASFFARRYLFPMTQFSLLNGRASIEVMLNENDPPGETNNMKNKSRWARFLAAGGLAGFGGMVQAVLLETLDGNPATAAVDYDTALGLTWMDDSNHTETGGYDGNGLGNGMPAPFRALELNPKGSVITNWRFQTTLDLGSDRATFTSVNQVVHYGFNIKTGPKIPHRSYTPLGDKAYDDTEGSGPQAGLDLTGTSPFSSVQSNLYWLTAEVYTPGTSFVSEFDSGSGSSGSALYSLRLPAWAVSCGGVGAAIIHGGTATVWVMRRGLEKWSKVAHWVSILGVRSRRFPALHP